MLAVIQQYEIHKKVIGNAFVSLFCLEKRNIDGSQTTLFESEDLGEVIDVMLKKVAAKTIVTTANNDIYPTEDRPINAKITITIK